jgi:hypothetical protein
LAVAVQVLLVEMAPAPKVVTGVIRQYQRRQRLFLPVAAAGGRKKSRRNNRNKKKN